MTSKQNPISQKVMPTIPLPSADLITYRFDEADKKFQTMNDKLDLILTTQVHFPTEDKVQKMIDSSLKPVTEKQNSYAWYWRSVFTAMLLCIGGVIAALIERH